MKKVWMNGFVSVCALFVASCGTLPTATQNDVGSLDVKLCVSSAAGLSKVQATTWDSLVILVSSSGMSSIRRVISQKSFQTYLLETIEGIPVGDNRLVEAFTKTTYGDTIHYAHSVISSVEAGQSIPVTLNLLPSKGSIYVNLSNIPTGVDSILTGFFWPGDSIVVHAKRSSLLYLSIDNVPNGTKGTLIIKGIDIASKVLYVDSLLLTFSSLQNVSLKANFMSKPGGFGLAMSLVEPGVTVVTGAMAAPDTLTETGPVYISEIQYYADGDSDYIELHNPLSLPFLCDTLVLEVAGTSTTPTIKKLCNISIPANGYYVIGDSDAPAEWVDTVVSFDLTTTGRWISLRKSTGALIDRVAYSAGDQGWPIAKKCTSIEMPFSQDGQIQNNYGTSWKYSETVLIAPDLYGTPGR